MAKRDFLRDLFSALGDDYIVLRKHNAVPEGITVNDDLDLLVRPQAVTSFRQTMQSFGFLGRVDSTEDNIFLYGATPHEHFIHHKQDLHLDVVLQLMYRSPNRGEWIPAHQEIQESMWAHRVNDKSFLGKWRPSVTDELVHITAHGILDKKCVSPVYQDRIRKIMPLVDKELALCLLSLLFFKAASLVMTSLERGDFEGIYARYITFRDY